MPAYAHAVPSPGQPITPLAPGEITDLVEFLADLQGDSADRDAVTRGARLFDDRGGCYDCHGHDAAGDPAIGAPNLTDRIWLYGDGSREALTRDIADGREGTCPAWIERLSPAKIREVSLFVYSLSHPKKAS